MALGKFEHEKQALAEVVPSSCSIQVRIRFIQIKICTFYLYNQSKSHQQLIKRYISISNARLTDQ